MAIIESTDGTPMHVDPASGAARVTMRPLDATSWISLGASTGNLTAVGTGSSGILFAFRNASIKPVLIRRMGIGFVATTAFTTPQMISYAVTIHRNWTVFDTGGTAIALTGNNGKHRSTMANLTAVDCRIATTASLANGTKTSDANNISQVAGWASGQGVALAPSMSNLFGHDPEDYPLILGQNEGFNIYNTTTMGAAGVGVAFINIELAEMAAF